MGPKLLAADGIWGICLNQVWHDQETVPGSDQDTAIALHSPSLPDSNQLRSREEAGEL